MTRLYLVRHGAVAGDSGRVMGHHDLPLSATGAAQIEALAATWTGRPPDRLFASDLARAADSARLLAARFGTPLTLDPRLRELSFGNWEGRLWDDVHQTDRDLLAVWGERWWEAAPPGGETFDQLAERVQSWYCELREGELAVAVAHAGSLRVLLAELQGLPRDQIFELHLDYAHVSAVEVTGGQGAVLSLNQPTWPPPCNPPDS
jgi:broad specificity phosphatase PhoE